MIIPEKSSKVLEALNIEPKKRNLSFLDNENVLDKNVKIENLNILFKKIVN